MLYLQINCYVPVCDILTQSISDLDKIIRMSLFGQQSMTSFGSSNNTSFGAGAATGTVANPNKDYEVSNPSDDSISSLSFSPPSVPTNFLVAGSWDNNVRCWEIAPQNGQPSTIPKVCFVQP